MKRVFGSLVFIVVAFLILVSMPVLKCTKREEAPLRSVAGFEMAEDTKISAHLRKVFYKAAGDTSDAEYTPISYLGCGDGDTYVFLAKKTYSPEINPDVDTTPFYATVYIRGDEDKAKIIWSDEMELWPVAESAE